MSEAAALTMPEQGSGASAFRNFLRTLPAEVDRHGPLEMVFPGEPPAATRRLLETLGVPVLVEAGTGPLVRRPAEIETAWCARCRDYVLPHDQTGLCLWCDGKLDHTRPRLTIVAQAQLPPGGNDRYCGSCRRNVPGPAEQDTCLWCGRSLEPAPPRPKEERRMSAVAEHTVCKIPGCSREAAATAGRYAKLCSEHADEAKLNGGGTASSPAGERRFTVLAQALVKPARELDRARGRLAQAPQGNAAEAELAEAMRRVQGSPTPENLKRLREAATTMGRSAPTREKRQAELADAEKEFRKALAPLVQLCKEEL